MIGQIKEYALVAILLVICPLLVAYHGSALAQESDANGQVELSVEGEPGNSMKSLDVLIDNFSGLDDKEKSQLKSNIQAKIDKAVHKKFFTIGELVPFAGMLFVAFVISVPALFLLVVLVFAQRKRAQRAELIAKFIESGKEVPRELLVDHADADQKGGDANMRRGIVLMGIGLGVMLALGILAGWEVGALGFIPFFIGLARFIIWKLDSKTTVSEPAARD